MNITPAPSLEFQHSLRQKTTGFSHCRSFNSQIVDDKVPFIVNTSPDGQSVIVPVDSEECCLSKSCPIGRLFPLFSMLLSR